MTDFRATYRLMFGPGFGFREARELVPYLRDLGVSHLYLPPSFQARAGSAHGYDVVDPTRLSEDLGGEAEFEALAETAHDAGLGIVLDIVPNHMAADQANRWWAERRGSWSRRRGCRGRSRCRRRSCDRSRSGPERRFRLAGARRQVGRLTASMPAPETESFTAQVEQSWQRWEGLGS